MVKMLRGALLVLSAVCMGFASAALNTTKYSHSKVLKEGTMKIFWRLDADTIHLALEATATGWVGFGLAETTGMAGADIVYYEAASNKLVDSFAMKHAKPTVDSCQDWLLKSAEQIGSTLAVEMSRKLVLSDMQDRNITDDSAEPLLPTAVIAAWGDSEKIDYHCSTCRLAAAVRFFGTGLDFSPMTVLRDNSNLETHDFTVSNHVILEQETEYAEFCFDLKMRLGSDGTTVRAKHDCVCVYKKPKLVEIKVH